MTRVNRAAMLERIRQKQEESSAGKLSYVEKFNNNETRYLRILPPKSLLEFIVQNKKGTYELPDLPFRDVWIHYVGAVTGHDGDKIYCPSKMANRPCPICELVAKLKSSDSSEDVEAAKNMRCQHRYIFLVVDRKKESVGPMIWDVAYEGAGKTILGKFSNPDYGDISDPIDGRDLTVTRTGKGRDTTYGIDPRVKTSPLLATKDGELDTETLEEWLENIPDLNDNTKIRIFSYEELNDLVTGERTLKNLWEKSPTTVKDEEEEEEEEETGEVEEVEEPEEKPTKKSFKRSKK